MNDFFRTPSEGPQLRTLLLTDLVDSTGLVERLGDTPASELFREHDQLVLKLQQQWRGRLIDRSDGLLLLFERPVDGLGFALDYTRGLRDLGKARNVELLARAGLHVGEVLTWKNSDAAVQVGAKPLEVEGLAKPMAARLMTLARPGQILLSSVAEPLTHRASRELGERGKNLLWKSYGRWRFKGVPQSQEIHEVGEVGLAPLRAPSNNPKAWRDIPLWRRPAALAAEVVLLAGLGIGAWFLGKPQPAIAFAERDWVVVGDLRNLTGEEVLDDSLSQAFRISLEQSRYVNVLSDMKARDTLARMERKPGTQLDRAIASEIALRDGVRAVILPTVSEVGGRVRVSAEVIDPHTQTTVYAESADGVGAGSVLESIDSVTATLRGKLGEALASIEKDSEPLPRVTTKNLDALKAYALGQKAFGSSQYKEAKSFYLRAVELDSGFALSYLGLVRSYNALNDLAGGTKYLKRAVSLRANMPARDQLYLDAWTAEVESPADALDKWRQMASLYPDFYPAVANIGNSLYIRNQFAEGMPFAKRSTSPQSEFSTLSWDLVGRLALGQGKYPEAQGAFTHAIARGHASAVVRNADTYAAQRRFKEAGQAWPLSLKVQGPYFDRVAMYLDQGLWDMAKKEAAGLSQAAEKGSVRSRAALHPEAVVDWARGDTRQSLLLLQESTRQTLAAVDSHNNEADAVDDAYAAVAAGLLSQRMGETRLPGEIIRRLDAHPGLLQTPPLGALFKTLRANEMIKTKKYDQAITLLESLIDGGEPVQTHVALMEAYAGAGNGEKALTQAAWLGSHRGRAYIESGCGWCQQSLNVFDTTLSHLRAAELLAAQDRTADAKRELQILDSSWPAASLPDHLRVRREAVLGAFN
ncbi:MAG: putative peptide modification system cyclase [Pseudoxanthomonas sp.]